MTPPRTQSLGTYIAVIIIAAVVIGVIRLSLMNAKNPWINPNPQQIATKPALIANINEIYNNPLTPAFGNPKGDVTIVQYFDYQCTYCKADEESLEHLLQHDNNIRVIYKDFPKLGPHSVELATASLASLRQGADKYLKLHQAMLGKHATVGSEDALYQIAGSVGLDVDKLKQDMKDPAIAKEIQDSFAIGKSVGVVIVPTFIIGGYLVPGLQTYGQLKQMVDHVRSTHNDGR